MVFNSLSLYNFKNFASAKADFVDGINCIVGKNGVGKTNILDALHYLSLGKSAINPIDAANIRYEQDSFFIKSGITRNDSTLEVLCTVQTGRKKSLKVNQEEYARLSEHIGFIPVVMISPNDNSLILDGNEARRRFFDSTLSQINKQYLFNLVRYQKALKQRNALLKEFAHNMQVDADRLAPFDHELLSLAGELYEVRSKFLKKFESRFEKLYKKLSHGHEKVSLSYESHWQKKDPEKLFQTALKRDLALQRTTIGVHRDAYHFMIEDKPIKRFGSQGQQKSLIVGLKVAQFEELKKATKVTPVLLLDDIFDKLDDQRMAILLNMVCEHQFGQIFLTDARPERTRTMLAENKLAARIFTVNDGSIESIEDYEL
jgi:DNA replication and repair protein RecF